MKNTMQLYIDENNKVKGYPITTPDRVLDENGKSVKEKMKNNVKFNVVGKGNTVPPINGGNSDLSGEIDKIKEQLETGITEINNHIGIDIDGLQYQITDNSIFIYSGKIFKNGASINISNKTFDKPINTSLKLKRDVICINTNNELCYLSGELGSEPVFGYRVYKIGSNASLGDRLIFQGEVFTCVNNDTNSGNSFKLGSTVEETVISLLKALNKNDITSSFFNIYRNGTNLSFFEKVKGGGYTPDIIQNNGTLTPPTTSMNITCNEVKYSKQSVAEKPNIPNGYIELFEIRTQNNKIEIIDIRSLNKQVMNMYGNVKRFGAIGDGVTDDTLAIQKAIDNCNTVFFPKGEYYIKTGLKYTRDNITLIGEHATIIGESSEIGEPYIPILTSPTYDECSSRDLFKNLTIKGLEFKRKRLFFNEPDKLIFLRYVQNVLIENCSFMGWNGDAIGVDLLYASDNRVNPAKVSNNICVKNCIFDGIDNNNSQAFYVMNGHDIKIEGNLFKNCTRKYMPGAINLENWESSEKVTMYNITIINNTFENIRGDGGCINVYLKNPQSTYRKPFKNLLITNNIFNKCKGSFFSMINRGNKELDNWESHNVKVSNNIFNGTTDIYWLTLRVSGVKSIDITNNIFNNLCGTAFFGDTSGLELDNPQNISFNFSNNLINDFRPYEKYAGSIFNVGINKGFICDSNKLMTHGLYDEYKHMYLFKFIPKKASVLQHQVFTNNSIFEFKTKTIYTLVQDVVNGNNSNIIKANNILSDGIKEHNTIQE